ncbi:MAG: methyltransferase domain-containing protein [Planctomycetota bacterium]
MHVEFVCSRAEYMRVDKSPIFHEGHRLELHLARSNNDTLSFSFAGTCKACEQATDFLVERQWGAREIDGVCHPNWRESQLCRRCGLNSRRRLAVEFVAAVAHNETDSVIHAYVMEQVTPVPAACRRLIKNLDMVCSEYLGPDIPGGHVENGIRHENAEALSFPESTFDLVVCNDVLEHLPHPKQGISEMCRVLRTGGRLFVTIPFEPAQDMNVVRAEMIDGKIVHHLPEVYHGNPLSSSGSLVFTDFGWELIGQLENAGFSKAEFVMLWSYEYGHMGVPEGFFHATK